MHLKKLLITTTAAAALLVGVAASPAQASHAWGPYHWSTSDGVARLTVYSSLTPDWSGNLSTANNDWNASTHLQNSVVAGSTTSTARKRCAMPAGAIRICNAAYGSTGWAGLASINSADGTHISQASAKMNDTYLSGAVAAKRQGVMCQEVGHDFGLDHQDTNFTNANLGTCMDYTNDWSTNQHPNAHDFAELDTIYGHVDSAAVRPAAQPGTSTIRTGTTVTIITWAS